MALTRNVLFLVVAGFCFVVALGCALAIVHSNGEAWQDGGLVSLVIGLLP